MIVYIRNTHRERHIANRPTLALLWTLAWEGEDIIVVAA